MSPMQKNRALNDGFRKTAKGGVVTISMGIHLLGRAEVEIIMKRLSGPDGDNSCAADSDHECGEITVSNRLIYWEINCYDNDLNDLSPDPTNPEQTKRFMTLMLDSEV
ncbi:DUF3768 domain-containing protein [Loktanella sp. M215]|nr:DUF3768 domain-containing protein [Loktanella sp. M215]